MYLHRLLDTLKEAAPDPDVNTYDCTLYHLFWNCPLKSSPPSLSHGAKNPDPEALQCDSSPVAECICLFMDNLNCKQVNNQYHCVLKWACEHCNDLPEVEVPCPGCYVKKKGTYFLGSARNMHWYSMNI